MKILSWHQPMAFTMNSLPSTARMPWISFGIRSKPSFVHYHWDLENISTEEQCAIKTIMSDYSESKVRDIVRGVLWSDPSPRNEIRPNTTRTAGVFFGPDVARNFLINHNPKYLIRGHEVAENGTSSVMFDDDHSVVTVFSQPAYPDGLGTKLELGTDGTYTSVEFTHCNPPVSCPQAIKASNDQTLQDLRSLFNSRIW